MQFLSFFLHFWTWLSWFSFGLNRIFQVHDMTINFSFVLFFSFFGFFDLSTSDNDICHRWPFKLKHLFSMWGLFWKVGFLVRSCLYHFCLKRGLWLKSVLEKWVIFGQHALRHQSKMISKYHDLETCVFCHRGGFDRLEAVASLDAYQITNCQFLSKTHHFCCLISKNSRRSF